MCSLNVLGYMQANGVLVLLRYRRTLAKVTSILQRRAN